MELYSDEHGSVYNLHLRSAKRESDPLLSNYAYLLMGSVGEVEVREKLWSDEFVELGELYNPAELPETLVDQVRRFIEENGQTPDF